MSGFSRKLARKWTEGVLLEICMFRYTSNAAGKSWEVLHWLMQKYVKWWNATGNWNYFPTTFMLLNAAAVSASSYGGQETRLLCQPPLGSSMPGLGQGCCSRLGCGCLWSAPPAPGAWEIPSQTALSVLSGQEGWDVSFRLLWEFLYFQNKVVVSPIDWEWKLSKWEAFKTLCGYIK